MIAMELELQILITKKDKNPELRWVIEELDKWPNKPAKLENEM